MLSAPDPFELLTLYSSESVNMSNEEDFLRLYTQHPSLKPKSIFFPTHSKGPYLESFYRVVYADLVKL